MKAAAARKPLLVLSAIVIAGLIFRTAYLGHQSLWLDEFFSWECAKRGFWAGFYCDINKPPLYYPLLHYWMALFGQSERAMRSLSVLPGVASIWLLYVLTKRLLSREIAYIAAFYQAISTFHIYYAQEARNYTWLVFFLLLAGLYLWNAIEADTPRRRFRYYAAYALACALALYTHYFAVFFIAGHGAYVLLRRPRQTLFTALSAIAAVATVAPWLLLMLAVPGSSGVTARRYLLLKFPQAYFSFLFGDSLMPLDQEAVLHVRQTLTANAWILVVAIGAVAIFAPFMWRAFRRWREPYIYIFVNATVPVVITFLISFRKMLFDERYMIPSSPYVYMLVAAAVWEIVVFVRAAGPSGWKPLAALAAVGGYCFLLMVSFYNYYFVSRFGKEQWRDATAWVETSAGSGASRDLIVFDPDYLQLCFRYYLRQQMPFWPITPDLAEQLRTSDATVRSKTRGFDRIWLIRSHNDGDTVLNAVRGTLRQESYRSFPQANGIEVFSFRNR